MVRDGGPPAGTAGAGVTGPADSGVRHARGPGAWLRWLLNRDRGWQAWLHVLHRLSGLVLLAFLMAHVCVTSTRLLGRGAWEAVMALTHHPLLQAAEYAVWAAFAFHGANGVRVLLAELGFGIGRPDRPVYPYAQVPQRQRPWAIAAMVVTGVLLLAGLLDLPALRDGAGAP
jgi:succinate dehydrogenase / fumarate reductase cytochrome b subunit